MSTHQFKPGDNVTVNGIPGTIFTLGHAAEKGRKFNVCKHGKDVPPHLIGYQVNFGRKIKIIKETDIEEFVKVFEEIPDPIVVAEPEIVPIVEELPIVVETVATVEMHENDVAMIAEEPVEFVEPLVEQPIVEDLPEVPIVTPRFTPSYYKIRDKSRIT